MAGKKWLENKEKEPPKPPTENFPQRLPENSEPNTIRNKPIITAKKPSNLDNSLLIAKTEKKPVITNYQPELVISQISPNPPEKFSLTTIANKPPKISEQLSVITNKEEILLTKIKQLEQKLAQVQTENNHLKLENKHLKALIRQDQETEAKTLQPLPFKPNK